MVPASFFPLAFGPESPHLFLGLPLAELEEEGTGACNLAVLPIQLPFHSQNLELLL